MIDAKGWTKVIVRFKDECSQCHCLLLQGTDAYYRDSEIICPPCHEEGDDEG